MSAQAPSLGGAERTRRGPRLRWLREVWGSTVGKKLIVAVTGVVLVVYVILHVLGNLKTLQGNGGSGIAPVDTYAEWLRTVGKPVIPRDGVLWLVRLILISAFVVHIVGVAQLVKRNRDARPEGHRHARRIGRSFSAQTMAWTGVLLLAFIVFHILQFTTLTIHPTPLDDGTVYANLYDAFQQLWIVVLYVVGVILLGFHLRHGLWSVLQTHGYDAPNRNPSLRRGATTTAVLITVGFAAIPIVIYLGLLPAPHEAVTTAATAHYAPLFHSGGTP